MSGLSNPTCRDLLSSGAERVRPGLVTAELDAPCEHRNCLDQHRAQIIGEWIDTETGEVPRARVAPAGCAGGAKFVQRFRGREPEVALEATNGWPFVVEGGAVAYLAEPAETAGLGGPTKRARRSGGPTASAGAVDGQALAGVVHPTRSDPRSTRARQAGAHTLSERRSEWRQRIQATLYHHGCRQRGSLMVGDGWQCSPLSWWRRQVSK
jgi:transposase